MALTKNRQSKETICQMARKAFPNKQIDSCTELTEGMCNIAYLVEFTDGSKSVLKIAAGNRNGLLSNEVNMMQAEVTAMNTVRKNDIIKVADVQYYDASNVLCDGNYFFMEALDGQSYFSIMNSLAENEKRVINLEIGRIEKAVASISGDKFGMLGDENRYDTLFEFAFYLISNVLSDAGKKNIAIGVPTEKILEKLTTDKYVFDEVMRPVLVHWDMWEGNIFIKDKHVSGIIDWERAMWGEAYMDDRFRRHTRNQDFLEGYGKKVFSKTEMQRIYWYDVFLYLTMMTEGAYREYEDDGQYRWVKPLFEKSWESILLQ